MRRRIVAVAFVVMGLLWSGPIAEAQTTTLPPAAVGFTPVRTAARRQPSREGLVLPLRSPAIAACLPLSAPCVDSDTSLVLLRASDYELVWEPRETGRTLDAATEAAFATIGRPPSGANGRTFALPLLDPAGPSPVVTTLTRPERGELIAGTGTGTALLPTFVGDEVPAGQPSPPQRQPFNAPMFSTVDRLVIEEAVMVAFGGARAEPIFGVTVPPEWDAIDGDVIPLLTPGALPQLVRMSSSSFGLYVPLPPSAEGLRPSRTAESNGLTRGTIAFIAALAAGHGGLAGFIYVRKRRRRRRRRSYGSSRSRSSSRSASSR